MAEAPADCCAGTRNPPVQPWQKWKGALGAEQLHTRKKTHFTVQCRVCAGQRLGAAGLSGSPGRPLDTAACAAPASRVTNAPKPASFLFGLSKMIATRAYRAWAEGTFDADTVCHAPRFRRYRALYTKARGAVRCVLNAAQPSRVSRSPHDSPASRHAQPPWAPCPACKAHAVHLPSTGHQHRATLGQRALVGRARTHPRQVRLQVRRGAGLAGARGQCLDRKAHLKIGHGKL